MSSATQLDLKQLIAMQQQIATLAVRRKHIRSSLSGQHISRLRGRGMEFDEVRVYQPGDDVGTIDWKVTARKGTTHTKIYHEERERPVLISLDYRKSMFFATQGALKSVVATKIAALLAWHGVAHGDRLGGLIFSDTEHHEIKPSRGKRGVLKLLHQCCLAESWQQQHPIHPEQGSLEEMTHRLRRVSKHGSLIYILSDFRGLNEAAVANLALLARHNDVVLISVFDELERSFPASGIYPVFDGRAHVSCVMDKVAQELLSEQFEARQAMLEQLQRQYGLHLISVATTDDVGQTMRDQLWSV